MKNQALSVILKRLLNALDELVAKHATAGKMLATLEVNQLDAGGFVVFDGELVEFNDGIVLLADIVIRNEWRGGAENGFRHFGGEAEGGILWILVLLIGWLVRLVNNNEAEILHWRKESRARADDDLWLVALEALLPNLMANGFGLGGVLNDNILKMRLKIADNLRGEGDFWYENNDRLTFGERALGELDIDIGFAATGDAVEENRVGGICLYFGDCALLGGAERVFWRFV